MSIRAQPLKDHWKEQRLFFSRIVGAAAVVVFLTSLLIWRLVDLQIVSYQRFSEFSQDNQIDIEALAPTRGLIFDRNGNELGVNERAWQLVAVREDIDDLDGTLAALEALGLLDPENRPAMIESLRSKPRWQPVLLANLNEVQAATFAVRGHQFTGVDIQAGLIRFYPAGKAAAHAVGYMGSISTTDYESIDEADYSGTFRIGRTGIERAYEDRLHGSPGLMARIVDVHGRPTEEPVPEGYVETSLPVPGRNVYLALDVELQRAAEAALAGLRGAAVALDPRNGDVLTLVSAPAFDPNRFSAGLTGAEYAVLATDPNKPFLNRALLSDSYNPGSTMKPFLGLAGLYFETEHVGESHICTGEYRLRGTTSTYGEASRVFPHGETDLRTAIVRSCNVYFYGLGYELGIDRMEAFLRGFGFGGRLGIDIGGEDEGLVPGREWKRTAFRNRQDQTWYPGETVITAIGQGYIQVTPLQLAHATATLAARGQRYQPRLLIASESGETGALEAIDPVALDPIADVDPAHWQLVQDAMLGVTTEPRGTGFSSMGDADYTVAGKTGTAQIRGLAQDETYDEEMIEERYRDNGLFIAYAPAENPEIAIAVVVENQGGGSRTAAPVARKVLDAFFGRTDYVAQLVTF